MQTVIVTGGSGYIGSAICDNLLKHQLQVVNIDLKEPLDYRLYSNNKYLWISENLVTVDLLKLAEVIKSFAKGGGVLGIIHMAAWKDLPASYTCPNDYYQNNLISTINMLELTNMLHAERFIFSSTAGVYGDDCKGAIKENQNVNPSSPYGKSKLMCETIIADNTKVGTFSSFCLRYQNPIGGIEGVTEDDSDSMFGNILNSIRYNREFTVFGGDYDTEDGTCIRDYIDINDIAVIHAYFLRCQSVIGKCDVINVGRGEPLSCRQACEIVEKEVPTFKWCIGPRRVGDAPGSYADIEKLVSEYHFDKSNLHSIEDTIRNIIKLAQNDKS